jgi:hypothetical protein
MFQYISFDVPYLKAFKPVHFQSFKSMTRRFQLICLLTILLPSALSASEEALRWSSRTTGSAGWPSGIESGGGWYLAISGDSVLRTQDGLGWESVRVAQGVAVGALGHSGQMWLAVNGYSTYENGSSGHDVYQSVDDGASWVKAGVMASNPYGSLLKAGQFWVALAGTTVYRSSDNGVTWSAVQTGAQGWLRDIALGAFGVLVAVGEGGEIVTSGDNGATWTRRSSGTNKALYSVAFRGRWWDHFDRNRSGRLAVASLGNGIVLVLDLLRQWSLCARRQRQRVS